MYFSTFFWKQIKFLACFYISIIISVSLKLKVNLKTTIIGIFSMPMRSKNSGKQQRKITQNQI